MSKSPWSQKRQRPDTDPLVVSTSDILVQILHHVWNSTVRIHPGAGTATNKDIYPRSPRKSGSSVKENSHSNVEFYYPLQSGMDNRIETGN